MITNAEYLIQKYAEAIEKINNSQGDRDYRTYWSGVKNTYHSILCDSFPEWAKPGTTGYFVFNHELTYDEALHKVSQLITTI